MKKKTRHCCGQFYKKGAQKDTNLVSNDNDNDIQHVMMGSHFDTYFNSYMLILCNNVAECRRSNNQLPTVVKLIEDWRLRTTLGVITDYQYTLILLSIKATVGIYMSCSVHSIQHMLSLNWTCLLLVHVVHKLAHLTTCA